MDSKYKIIFKYLGPILHLMNDENVNEIMINKSDDVWVKNFGSNHEKVRISFDENQLKGLITLLASVSHREIGDEKSRKETFKIISAGILGFRFEAWSQPVSLYGPSLTVRKLQSKLISLEDYANMGTIKFENIQFLKQIVIERKNILIAGATGSGKTTFFNSLVNQIPVHERLLVIETIPEINITKRNALFLQADSEQGYSVNRLIESALRGMPDRILIGELRGKEADGFLTICNTGHPGSIATIHANSSLDVLIRLEDMVIEGRKNQSIESIKKRISCVRPTIIYLKVINKNDKHIPVLTEIIEITGLKRNEYTHQKIFTI